MDCDRRIQILKKLFFFFVTSLILLSCEEEIQSDYQKYMDKNYSEVLFILNGEAESFSAYAPSDGAMYRDIQLVGFSGSSEAWPKDILYTNDSIYVVNSGQNTIERFNAATLDYEDDLYLDNGFNPMTLCLVGGGTRAAISGYGADQVKLVDLDLMTILDSANVYGSTAETNATDDSYDRNPTGLAAAGTTLYASNIRYSGTGFREATISIFSIDGAYGTLNLVKEINLEEMYDTFSGESYTSDYGLNPQSLFVLNEKLHVICTGTNGGSEGDDGKILILDITDSTSPTMHKVLEIGGSPEGFRSSMDTLNGVMYLAGVGGVQSYDYVNETILHDSRDLILAGSDSTLDYYSHVLYNNGILYVSDWTHDKLNLIDVSSNDEPIDSITCGDGPGALLYLTY